MNCKARRHSILALALALVMTLSACGGKGNASSSAGNSGNKSSASGEPASSTAASDYYKGKNITLYCGFSAGGGSDLLCRLVSAKVSEILGTTCTVENVTGASGWVCWTQMMENTKPDGYSFFMVNTPNVTTGKYDTDNPMKYDQNDMELICNQVTDSSCIAIRTDESRYTDWDGFVSYWKEQGVLMTSASAVGITSDDSTIATQLSKDIGTEVDIVVSGGASDNQTLLLNGTTDFMTGNVSEMAGAYMEGSTKILCVFAEERDPALPDVPTYEELTGHKITGCSSRGYAMLKDIPEEAKTELSEAVKAAVQDPEIIKQLADIYTLTDYKDGQDYIDYMNEQQRIARETWGM